MMDNCTLTETMKVWLRELYFEAIKAHTEAASNLHVVALVGNRDMEEQLEEYASEHREFAHILSCLAKELDFD